MVETSDVGAFSLITSDWVSKKTFSIVNLKRGNGRSAALSFTKTRVDDGIITLKSIICETEDDTSISRGTSVVL